MKGREQILWSEPRSLSLVLWFFKVPGHMFQAGWEKYSGLCYIAWDCLDVVIVKCSAVANFHYSHGGPDTINNQIIIKGTNKCQGFLFFSSFILVHSRFFFCKKLSSNKK